jgi:DNA polymerase bacteriophage-type
VGNHPVEGFEMSIRDFIARHSVAVTPAVLERKIALEAPQPATTKRPVAPIVPPKTPIETKRSVVPTIPEITPAAIKTFFWDVETRSVAKLGPKGVGTRAYAEHSTTEVLCVAFALGDGPIEVWVPGDPLPKAVLAAGVNTSCKWCAHHAAFERAILESILVPQHGWPMVPAERHICSMALALSHGCPGSLDGAASMLDLVNRKDAEAQKEVKKMWQPRKPKRGEDPDGIYWVDTPELRELLCAYCKQDVAAERELHQRLPALIAEEQEAWVIDAEINDRGVLIDAPLATAASRLAIKAMNELNARINKITDGAVDTASKTQKLKNWLVTQGVTLPRKPQKKDGELQWRDSLDADDIQKLLAGDLPNEGVREALEIRLQAAQSAATKIDRMLSTRCADGRVRNIYKMYGATTGRWTGEGFQPQNLKKPELLKSDEDIAAAIKLVRAEKHGALKKKYGDVLAVIGDLCRSMLIPAPGKHFIVGDFSAIEARVLPWLAGDKEKLETFRQFDRGEGRDIYCIAAEQVLGVTDVVPGSQERALGKIFELGLGFSMAAERLLAHIQKSGHPRANSITIKDTARWVRKWRARNPKIVSFWAALHACARYAVRHPDTPIPCDLVSFEMRGDVLSLRLPSGRELKYPKPVLKPGKFGSEQVTFVDTEAGRQRGKQMYGGMWAENVTQAAARDLLVDAMKRMHAAGYEITLHTHDEIGAEMPIKSNHTADEFKQLLIEVPSWASGLPVAAKVFTCDRFKKD